MELIILIIICFQGSTRPLAHPIMDKAAGDSVFEDHIAAYKVEDTPMEFSRATSLSSLSIDDEPRDVKVCGTNIKSKGGQLLHIYLTCLSYMRCEFVSRTDHPGQAGAVWEEKKEWRKLMLRRNSLLLVRVRRTRMRTC